MDIKLEIEYAFRWLAQLTTAALRRQAVRSLLIILGVLITVSGFLLAAVDPAITSPLAGIWYALVTLAHVGYGDIVATSALGRFISGVLILAGIIFFALAAGIFASILVVHDLTLAHESDSEEQDSHASFERKILQQLKQIDQRLNQLDAKESAPPSRGRGSSRQH